MYWAEEGYGAKTGATAMYSPGCGGSSSWGWVGMYWAFSPNGGGPGGRRATVGGRRPCYRPLLTPRAPPPPASPPASPRPPPACQGVVQGRPRAPGRGGAAPAASSARPRVCHGETGWRGAGGRAGGRAGAARTGHTQHARLALKRTVGIQDNRRRDNTFVCEACNHDLGL